MTLLRTSLLAAGLLSAFTACDSEKAGDEGVPRNGVGGAGGQMGALRPDSSGGSEGASEGECDFGTESDETSCVGVISGTVVDEDGAAVSNLPVTVCGPICFRDESDSQGRFAVKLDAHIDPSLYSVQPHGTPDASTFYYTLPGDLGDGDFDAGTIRVVSLPADGDLIVSKLQLESDGVSPEQTVASGPVTMTFGEGTVVRLSINDALHGDEGRRFRATELSETEVSEFSPQLAGARVFALGPFEATLLGPGEERPLVRLSIENTLGWEPRAAVEVLALGTYLDVAWVTPSIFETVGMAEVSDDGASIVLAEGADPGIAHLTWLAVRLSSN